jgi:hypothetical protein
LRRSKGENSSAARFSTERQSLTGTVPAKRADRLFVRLSRQYQGIVIDAYKLHRPVGISDSDNRLAWMTGDVRYT